VIAVHSPHPLKQKRQEEKFLPQFKMMYPVTVFLTITEPPGKHYGSNVVYRGHIQLHHPADTETVRIGEEEIVLEADYTTPLAYTVEGMPYYSGLAAMLDVADNEKFEGLYMLEPYDNTKIPLLFVHGLMSEPKTWMPMINTLIGDPVLRKRYQVWFYLYPTGNPILLSAASLRDALKTVHETYHDDGDDSAFHEMAIVGHSMGGILTKLMLVHSSNCFWDAVMDIPLEQSGLTDEEKKFFHRLFFFEPFKPISRAVFISAPLRGSPMADQFYSRLGSAMVHMPEGYTDLMKDSFRRMDEAHRRHNQRFDKEEMYTGIDSLSPGNPMLKILDSRMIPTNVTYHSIIGDNTAADNTGGTDGIVPYWSSHQDGATSEKVIFSGHNAQKQPAGILEVQRILHEHLKH
jgi:pimeloyl-ACP methyl ester carboxylesterase